MRVSWPALANNKIAVEIFRWLGFLAFVGLIVLSIFLFLHHRAASQPSSQVKALRQAVTGINNTSDGYLKMADYKNFEDAKSLAAQNYLNIGDVGDAEPIMNEVFAKVPPSKLDYLTYSVMMELQKQKHNTTQEKYYGEALIKLLQSQGDTINARLVQQEINGL